MFNYTPRPIVRVDMNEKKVKVGFEDSSRKVGEDGEEKYLQMLKDRDDH